MLYVNPHPKKKVSLGHATTSNEALRREKGKIDIFADRKNHVSESMTLRSGTNSIKDRGMKFLEVNLNRIAVTVLAEVLSFTIVTV